MAALSHIKSSPVADMTGTITVFNSQGSTTTMAATDVVRPSDWNSVHNLTQTISGNTAGSSTMSGTNIVYGGTNGIQLSASTAANAATMWVGNIPNSVYFPRQHPVTGSGFSSHAPATTYFMPFTLADPIAFKWVVVPKTISVAFPAGTSSGVAQSFRHGYTNYVSLFQRRDYANSSLSLTYVTHGSLVATASLTHTSTSMGYTLFYNTDTTGGTSSTNTTSNATANIAAYFNGNRIAVIPFPATTLTEGEYWLAFAHSSTTAATSNTATTIILYSNLHFTGQAVGNFARFASTNATSSSIGLNWPTPEGVASAITSNADMNMSVISNNTINDWYCQLVNFP